MGRGARRCSAEEPCPGLAVARRTRPGPESALLARKLHRGERARVSRVGGAGGGGSEMWPE